jgi:hypothetical protein
MDFHVKREFTVQAMVSIFCSVGVDDALHTTHVTCDRYQCSTVLKSARELKGRWKRETMRVGKESNVR